MAIYKRGGIWWTRFMIGGNEIRQSTGLPTTDGKREVNRKAALNLAAEHKGEAQRLKRERKAEAKKLGCALEQLARCPQCEKWFDNTKAVTARDQRALCSDNCRRAWEKRSIIIPTLKDFLENEFLPYAETAHVHKPLTLRYYKQGADMLHNSRIAALPIDQLSDQNAQHFAAEYARLSPSGINRGLRTLRRALNLAYQWGRLEKPAKIFLAKNERQRDRVLTQNELASYLAACPQPWKDCATIIAEEGMRPSEVFMLQWQHVLLNGSGGLIRIAEGKSKAARRVLPMTPNVYALLQARYEAAGRPTEGWLFPSGSECGHFDGNAAKDQHKRALDDSKVQRFEPYILRHTALTNLAQKGADAHTLARIAGHSSIVITMRYVHPQADAIERAFALAHGKVNRKKLGTKVGRAKEQRGSRLLA